MMIMMKTKDQLEEEQEEETGEITTTNQFSKLIYHLELLCAIFSILSGYSYVRPCIVIFITIYFFLT
jgi:hypothetical protein